MILQKQPGLFAIQFNTPALVQIHERAANDQSPENVIGDILTTAIVRRFSPRAHENMSHADSVLRNSQLPIIQPKMDSTLVCHVDFNDPALLCLEKRAKICTTTISAQIVDALNQYYIAHYRGGEARTITAWPLLAM